MAGGESSKKIITAAEVANYVVCPEAWRLKYFGHGPRRPTERASEGHKLREEWTQKQDLSNQLRHYAKIAYALLVIIVIAVFLLDRQLSAARRRHSQTPDAPPAAEAAP